MDKRDQAMRSDPLTDSTPTILICLLGNFRLLKAGRPVTLRGGGKTEALLGYLGLQQDHRVSREKLVTALWPTSDAVLASQSLNSLVYSLHKLIGIPLVQHEDGCYQINTETGVSVDVACFDAWANAGDRQARAGDRVGAAMSYGRAVRLYRGDLCVSMDIQAVVERERLQARYLTLLAYLAEYHYNEGDYGVCMEYVWSILTQEPCREDAHRLLMRCYVRRGERATALRHARRCTDILNSEFAAVPEPATLALVEQIRLQPDRI